MTDANIPDTYYLMEIEEAPRPPKFFEYEKCLERGAHLGLSITVLDGGGIVEWKATRPRSPHEPIASNTVKAESTARIAART